MAHTTFFKSDMKSRTRARDERTKAEAGNWRAVCSRVTQRDVRHCRACGRRANPDALSLLDRAHHHHIVFRSAGGADSSENVCLLCAKCHDDVHRYGLKVEGNADATLTFTRVNLETGVVQEQWESQV